MSSTRQQMEIDNQRKVEEARKLMREHYECMIKSAVKASVELRKHAGFCEARGCGKELRNVYVSLGEFISKIQIHALTQGFEIPRT